MNETVALDPAMSQTVFPDITEFQQGKPFYDMVSAYIIVHGPWTHEINRRMLNSERGKFFDLPSFKIRPEFGPLLDRPPGLRGKQPSRRHRAGHNLPAMPAIDAEVRVRGENDRFWKRFAHAHQASIGEAHGYVCVFLQ